MKLICFQLINYPIKSCSCLLAGASSQILESEANNTTKLKKWEEKISQPIQLFSTRLALYAILYFKN